MHTETIPYKDGDLECEGFVAFDESASGKRPCVLVSHAWAGQGDFEREKCKELAELGYVGFALDNYGGGKLGQDKDENAALMTPFVENRGLLRGRLLAGFEAAKRIDQVDGARMGAIGFCFGGLCALDLGRAGADLRGIVSFHGLLMPTGIADEPIRAKVLVLHGHDDPMVTREQFDGFTAEMTAAGVDWQVHQYGNTLHAFTNPAANDPDFGTVYAPKADRRSWESMRAFFGEVFV